MLTALVSAATLALPAPALAEPNAGDRWAIVVGVGAYDNASIPPAPYAVAGAEAVHQLFVGSMGFKPDHVILLTDRTERKPTLRSIRWALGTFLARAARRDDTVLIYFAGQGGVETDPRGLERDGLARYLLPRDADPGDYYTTALPMDGFLEMFAGIEAERVAVFLDASYSGAAGGRTFAPGRPPGANADLLLQRLARSKGRAIMASSRPSELSIAPAEMGQGVFTHYLVQGLTGAADHDKDATVTLQELYEYVESQVTRKSRAIGAAQHPVLKGELDGALLPLTRVQPP